MLPSNFCPHSSCSEMILRIDVFSVILPPEKHVMLSCHTNNQDLITKIGRSLRDPSLNIPVWFSEQGNQFKMRNK